jgi:protein involved in polysaccharide export with SLBB domain
MNAKSLLLLLALALALIPSTHAGVVPGDSVKVIVRGIPGAEQERINGSYTVSPEGIRLPFLPSRLPVVGLEPAQIAIAAEKAYKTEGIYQTPAIDVEILRGADQKGAEAQISVGGQVKKSGPVAFRQGMTLLQAVQAAGDRTEFGSRNIQLIRGGKTTPLDFRKTEHKNFPLEPNDSIIIEQRGVLESDRG